MLRLRNTSLTGRNAYYYENATHIAPSELALYKRVQYLFYHYYMGKACMIWLALRECLADLNTAPTTSGNGNA